MMSQLFNMLLRFVIAFLPRSKCLLISGQQSLSAVILDPKKIKFGTVSIFSPSVCHEVMGLDAMVRVGIGKEFSDMRQNEREIKFIRIGDAVRTAGRLKGPSP